MDYVISFIDNTCPICGEGKLESKNLYSNQQIDTIDRYECNVCKKEFLVERTLSESGDYIPNPLYTESKIQNLKLFFYKEESK